MDLKLQTRAFERVAARLRRNEHALAAARALVGKVDAGRAGTIITQGVLLDVAGSLGSHLLTRSKKQFIVVTDRRVIFLPQTFLGGPGAELLGELPRHQVRLIEADLAFVSVLRLAFGDKGDGVSLTFPRQDKRNAQLIVDALQTTPVA